MTGRRGRCRLGLAGLAAAIAALAIPSPAGAVTPVGDTFTPGGGGGACADNITFIQASSAPPPSAQYAAPFPGVLTSWNFEPALSPPQLRLKVARFVTGNFWTIVGQSPLETIDPSTINTFQTRISVQAGDVLGLYSPTSGACSENAAGYQVQGLVGDIQPGVTAAFQPPGPGRLDVSAILEPDADNDGFGDETQDQCPSHAGPDDGCDRTAPDVQIVSGPPEKTTKRTATFVFEGTDARAISGFQCKLDAAAFAACTSPHTVKVKKGKHTFQVQAIDEAGNADGSPATDTWKVKKKKKKKKK